MVSGITCSWTKCTIRCGTCRADACSVIVGRARSVTVTATSRQRSFGSPVYPWAHDFSPLDPCRNPEYLTLWAPRKRVGYTRREICDGQSPANAACGHWLPDVSVVSTLGSCRATLPKIHRGVAGVSCKGDGGDVPVSFRRRSRPQDGGPRGGGLMVRSIARADRFSVLGSFAAPGGRSQKWRSEKMSRGVASGGVRECRDRGALYRQKRKWRLECQSDPLDYLEQASGSGVAWRRNYSSVWPLEEKVLEAMRDQASRGQVLVLPEEEARRRFPDLVVTSLGPCARTNPYRTVTARVLFDGTRGLCVNWWAQVRDQERAPIASDAKIVTREKNPGWTSSRSASTSFNLSVRRDFLGYQVVPGSDVFHQHGGNVRRRPISGFWS